MKSIKEFSEDHPIISMIVGYALLLAFAMAFLPSDPVDMRVTTYKERT